MYKHFAILGQESNRAAEASECAAEQDAFWAYHDAIFEDQVRQGSRLDSPRLVELAEELSLDTEAFETCLSSGRYSMQIAQESQVVQSLGVRGTPAFLLNGIFISGAQPFEAFEEIIEDQLNLLEGG